MKVLAIGAHLDDVELGACLCGHSRKVSQARE
jgi:hypothetical protein